MTVEYPFKEKEIYGHYEHMHDYDHIDSELLHDGTSLDLHPVISVVIPAYDCQLLTIAIESALNQNFDEPYEILVLDNCGINNENILSFIQENDRGLIRYYRNRENIGMFGNWNRCISLAKADYITYLHADDRFLSNTLSNLWRLHLSIPQRAAIIGRYSVVDENDNTIRHYDNPKHEGTYYKVSNIGLFFDDSDTGCGALFHRESLRELGGWNPDFYPSSDRVLILNYAQQFGLYRLNRIVRIETEYISTSNTVNKKYPSTNYYLSKAVYYNYLRNKIYLFPYPSLTYQVLKCSFLGESWNLMSKIEKVIWLLYRFCYFRSFKK